MSDKGDLLKALKQSGFKLVEEGSKHLRYSNGSWTVSIPKGEKMAPGLVRSIKRQCVKPQVSGPLNHSR